MDGELTGVEMLEIRRHLDECESCSEQHDELLQGKYLLSCLPYAQPRPGFAEALCASLYCVQVPAYQKIFNGLMSFGKGRLTPVAAGCLGLGAVVMFLVAQPGQTPQTYAQLPGHSAFASSIGLEEASLNFPTVSYSAPESDKRRSYLPTDSGEDTSGRMMTLTSYSGP